jgi:hypothetical protein
MSHKRSPHQDAHGKAHGRPVRADDMHPHTSATKHTPRGGAGTRPAHPSKDEFARRMRGLEGAHGSGQDMEAERREKRLTGKSI